MTAKNTSSTEVLHILDIAYKLRGVNLKKSIELAQQALTMSRELEDPSLIGNSLSKLALFHMNSTEHTTSIEMSEEAIQHFKSVNDEIGIADAKYNIAGVYYKTNNYHLGMFHLVDCLNTYRKYNDRHNESKTQKSLGTIYELFGDQESAIKSYERAIECAIEIGNKNLESNAYNPFSGVLLKRGEIDKALILIEKSIALKKETGDIRGYAFAIYGKGKIYLYLKKYKEALSFFKEAIHIHKEAGDSFGIGMAYYKMAQLFVATNKRKKAKKLLKKALAFSKLKNLSLIKYKCYHSLYKIYEKDNKPLKSLEYLKKYIFEKDAAINSQTLRVIQNYERISRIKIKENQDKLEKQKLEIIAKQQHAEQVAKIKQDFLSAMSHEIRTPLNAITSIISLLEERSDDSEKKLMTSLQFSAKNLLRIINDILDFSKLESSKMILEKHPVKFKELLQNIKQTYISLADEKGILLNLSIAPTMADSYTMDETKLFQILGNLVSNAIKFTDEGSVDIVIDLIKSKKEIDIVAFKVKDTGIGIPPQERERLFESFYIPQSITTRNDGGTGLGLAIVKKLINLHDSTITVESKEGQGSTFYFELALEKAETPEKIDIDMLKVLQNKTAILAEDNEINALVMRKLLNKWGIIVKRVKNGKQAIVQAQEIKVDFILMDIHMPEMNGYDATRIIKTTKNKNQHTPVFALTADITSANKEEYKDLFNGFLWKPIEVKRLFNALTEVHTEKEKR